MNFGTSHFVSESAAVDYYSSYYEGEDSAREAVKAKIKDGEISIGKPSVKGKVFVKDGRYHVEEG